MTARDRTLSRLFAAWRAEVDEAVGAIPGLGGLAAPAWRVVRIDQDALARGEAPAGVRPGRGPAVARLAGGAGLELALDLPAAAARDLESAVELALGSASPIDPRRAAHACDSGSMRRTGSGVSAVVSLADREAAAAASDLVRRACGRCDAVDVEHAGDPRRPPRIDLLTGSRAVRRSLSASHAVIAAALAGLVLGAAGLAGAAFIGRTPALVRTAPEAAALDLASLRRAAPPLLRGLDAVSASLPPSAFLERFEMNGRELVIAGRAMDAAGLLAALEAHPDLEGAAFSGPTRGLEDGRQGFEITLSLQADSAS